MSIVTGLELVVLLVLDVNVLTLNTVILVTSVQLGDILLLERPRHPQLSILLWRLLLTPLHQRVLLQRPLLTPLLCLLYIPL